MKLIFIREKIMDREKKNNKRYKIAYFLKMTVACQRGRPRRNSNTYLMNLHK